MPSIIVPGNQTVIGKAAAAQAQQSIGGGIPPVPSPSNAANAAYNAAQAKALASGATAAQAAAAGAQAGDASLAATAANGGAPNAGTPAAPEAASPTTAAPVTTTSGPKYQIIDSGLAKTILNNLLAGSGTPNVLNQYQNCAYHFRFFCINDIDLYSAVGTPTTSSAFYNAIVPDPNQAIGTSSAGVGKVATVVIAESGNTIYNIKSVEFTSMIGANLDTRNVNIGTFQMVIVEPLGGSFLTALKSASDVCQNFNFKNCFYYLELSFKAYDFFGNQVSNIFSSVPNAQQGDRWIWEVQITDIAINIDASGGTYTLSLILSDGMALDDEIHAVPAAINVTGNTLQEYFDNLGVTMSQTWQNNYLNTDVKYGDPTKNIPAVKFFPIQYDPASKNTYPGVPDGANPGSFTLLDPTSLTTNPKTNLDTDIDSGSLRGNMQPGITIEQLIEAALCCTTQGQILGLSGKKDLSQANPPGTPNESFVFRVIPTVIINGFNSISGRYQVTVTYNVVPYYTQIPIISPTQTLNSTSQIAVQSLVNRGLLQKRYDYIFTGKNTEIINLDIALNAKWTARIPSGYAIFKNTAAYATSATVSPNKPNQATNNAQQAAQAQVNSQNVLTQSAALSALASGSQISTTQIATDLANLSSQGENSTTSVSDILSEITTENANITNYNKTYNANIPLINTNQTTTLSSSVQTTQSALSAANAPLITRENALVGPQKSEVNLTPGTVAYAENLILNPNGTPAPLLFKTTFSQGYKDVDDQSGPNLNNSSDSGQVLLGAVLNQMYDYSADPLMAIDLEIRGDPYWLGETNLSKCVYFRGSGTPTNANSYQSPQLFGEMCFILDFKIPYQVSSSGSNIFQPQLIADETYRGVYIATTIKNTFADGQFTQVLSGKRQPLIDLLQAQGLTSTTLADGSSGDTSSSSGPNSNSTGAGSIGSTAYLPPANANALQYADQANNGLSPGQIMAESGGNQFDANGNPLTSSSGAIGIAQLEPQTAQYVAEENNIPYSFTQLQNDPAYNANLGNLYMQQLTRQFNGNYSAAIAAYNAGPGGSGIQEYAQTGNTANLPTETQNYLAEILPTLSKSP